MAEAGTFAKEVRATFPVIHDPKNTIFGTYGVESIPANVIIDKKGKVVKVVEGPDLPAIEAAINAALK